MRFEYTAAEAAAIKDDWCRRVLELRREGSTFEEIALRKFMHQPATHEINSVRYMFLQGRRIIETRRRCAHFIDGHRMLEIPLKDLVGKRTSSPLERRGIMTIGDVTSVTQRWLLSHVRDFGQRALNDLIEALTEIGSQLPVRGKSTGTPDQDIQPQAKAPASGLIPLKGAKIRKIKTESFARIISMLGSGLDCITAGDMGFGVAILMPKNIAKEDRENGTSSLATVAKLLGLKVEDIADLDLLEIWEDQ